MKATEAFSSDKC